MNLEKNNILVELFMTEEKTNSCGLVVIEDEKMKNIRKGLVIDVNEKCRDLKKGDKVMFDHAAGYKFLFDSKQCIVMKEDEVICAYED